jgi:ribulose-5-phosphate 4-epimerase/fuculose-1-phosphate aldolase
MITETLAQRFEELVTANRILAREGIVDSFGHVSIRHPDIPERYLLSRARAPECIEVDDVMDFTLEGAAVDAGGRKPYAERFIHGAVYEARSDIHAVVHHHSPGVIPFGVTVTSSPPNTRCPVSISQSTQPNAQMSLRLSTDVPGVAPEHASSGALVARP